MKLKNDGKYRARKSFFSYLLCVAFICLGFYLSLSESAIPRFVGYGNIVFFTGVMIYGIFKPKKKLR